MGACNENCRGCGARITRVVCVYCGRRADPQRDRIKPDPKDDPRRHLKPRTVRF